MEFSKKKVLIVGLGKSGLSAARWLAKAGAEVTVSEIQEESSLKREVLQELSSLGITLETGGHQEETFLSSQMIILSPGVPLDIAPLKAAGEKRIPILGEMELAARLIHTPIVAVSGTNGKSTATTLVGDLLRKAGLEVVVAGNIGTPLMEFVTGSQKADYIVVEVSSFQLDTMETFAPLVSILLNISPDHLDRYADYEAYIQSKLRIFENQKGPDHYAILNDDDEILSRYEPPGGITVLRYGFEKGGRRQAFIDGKKLYACLPGKETYSFPLDRFRLPGRHNLENLMGAILAGLALGLAPQTMQEGLDHYQALPHRLEHVKRFEAIDFYDDSKATNVAAAVESILSFDRPVILIAGGRHKGGDYAPLVRAAKDRVRKAIFMGEAKHLLAEAFDGIIPFHFAESMEDAVSRAFSLARPDHVVLLAPACSSFDMFSDYAHRGKAFRDAIERITRAR